MQLIQLNGPSLDLIERRDAPDPAPPAPGQVQVRMHAASINYLDLGVAQGAYPGLTFPLIPIADGAGEIVALGDGVEDLAIGDRVAIHPKSLWLAGEPVERTSRAMRGVNLRGSLVEVNTVDAAACVKAPEHLSWEAIAALPVAATTAWNALTVARASPGSTVVLLGTGGVSIFALQLAKARGARVIITSSSNEKLERARALGADDVINYRRDPDWDACVSDLTGGIGADLVIDSAGAATFPRALNAVRQGGCVFAIGFITGTAFDFDLMPVIVKSVRVQGNNTGSVADLARAIQAIEAHRIEPVVDAVFGLDQLASAYETVAVGKHFGKVAITLDW